MRKIDNLRDLVLSGVEYVIQESTMAMPDKFYIIPRNKQIPGYEQYTLIVAPKNMSEVIEIIEKYESYKDSPLYRKLEGIE